ncbi:MAG: hypothetical protein JO337_00085 [Acidimicrobiales bacterium]|nr:hypothetical protein [Acidimicrobiales bacterium]
MHLSPLWIVPLIAGGVAAGVLAVAAGALRREVARLQRAMRPLRVTARRRH